MKKLRKIRKAIWISCLALLAVGLIACGANEAVLRSGKETPFQVNTTSKKTSFENELEAMRTAGFTFIYALRRKDRAIMDADDISVIKLQTVDTNRRVKTDDDRAIIIGTNKEVPANNLEVLYERFAVENYSEPPVADANGQANSNK